MHHPATLPLQLRPLQEPRPRLDVAPPFKKLVSGWLCLDFVNTVHAWVPATDGGAHGDDDRPLGDKLTAYGALLHWAREAKAVDGKSLAALEGAAAHRPDEAAGVLARATTLRAALYRVFGARLLDRRIPRDALDVLGDELGRLRHGEYLAEDDDGTVQLAWGGGAGDLDGVLWPVIRSALDLLSSEAWLGRLRQCNGEECGWLFVDVSRGGRRRWCDMADCGNVAKVRAHRAKEGRSRRK